MTFWGPWVGFGQKWVSTKTRNFPTFNLEINFTLVRGGALKTIANFFGVFRVKNDDFTSKNYIFSNFRGVAPPPKCFTEVYDEACH
jgi:hypothetical protein